MPVVVFSRGMCNTKDPSALVNVCIWFVSRAHLGVQTPCARFFRSFVPGVVFRSFFCSAADVFFGRAASVETCECRARV